MGGRRLAYLWAGALVAGLAVPPMRGQTPPALDTVLSRASAYAARYLDALSNLIADERYVQEVSPSGLRPRRELGSEIVFVRAGPPLEWWSYRDVFEVDGRAVRDRDGRIARLFLEPAATARAQAVRIHWEGARFNLGIVGRTLNVPGVPILFLQPALRSRFQFVLDRRDVAAGDDVWIVKFEERTRPTLFQHNAATDNPSEGRLWIHVATGTVVRTEHVVTPRPVTARFTTRFREDRRFGVALPIEMREQAFDGLEATQSLDGTARYSNFRRFAVHTEDAVREP